MEIANQLFAAVGGTLPRLFIQYPDVDQKQGAEALRTAVVQGQINGQAIIVPEIQHVTIAPDRLELRYFKTADHDEAVALAAMLNGLLHFHVVLNDRSSDYETRPDVKRRTYKLWFPRGLSTNITHG